MGSNPEHSEAIPCALADRLDEAEGRPCGGYFDTGGRVVGQVNKPPSLLRVGGIIVLAYSLRGVASAVRAIDGLRAGRTSQRSGIAEEPPDACDFYRERDSEEGFSEAELDERARLRNGQDGLTDTSERVAGVLIIAGAAVNAVGVFLIARSARKHIGS